MFITDKADLLPHWLRFVSGVVDTEDLPLNVSREMLQTTPVLGRIRKALIGRVLSELRNRAKAPETKETDAKEDEARASGDYAAFWENFGAIVKEGLWEDAEHRNEILPLVRFHSSTQDGVVSLADYVARMQPGQDTIYYLTGDNIEAMKSSPQLEGFRAKGIEVLLMFDPIDNFWPERSDTFEGKKLVAVTQAAGEFGKDDSLPDISVLLSAMKEALGEDVADVRSTGRLTDSAVVLAADDKGPDLQVQRLMRRAGRAMMPSRPILEVNPRHKLIEGLILKQDDKDLVKNVAETLLDLARVQEGEPLKDASGFARRVSTLLAGSLAA
jgi:molecular chaperone HtpG